jgi:hypothetical protein
MEIYGSSRVGVGVDATRNANGDNYRSEQRAGNYHEPLSITRQC